MPVICSLQPPSPIQHIVAYLAKDDILCSPANCTPIAVPSFPCLPPACPGSTGRGQVHRFMAVRKRQVTWILQQCWLAPTFCPNYDIWGSPSELPRTDFYRSPGLPRSGTYVQVWHFGEAVVIRQVLCSTYRPMFAPGLAPANLVSCDARRVSARSCGRC